MPKFTVPATGSLRFGANMSVSQYPLYNAGPRVRRDLKNHSMAFSAKTSIQSHVKVLSRMVQATYQHDMKCDFLFNPLSLKFLEHNCTIQRIK